jgi:hypothetical protein
MSDYKGVDFLRFLDDHEDIDHRHLQKNFPHRPTLFLGLGGTGANAVAAMHSLFVDLYGEIAARGQDAAAPTVPFNYAFLAFDTDINGRPPSLLQGTQWVHIGVEDLADFYEGQGKEPFYRDWLIQGFRSTQLMTGAGGLRNLGRLGLMANINTVRDTLIKARDQITGTAGVNLVNTRPVVYLYCSLSGGTGAGTFLDISFLLRYLMPDAEINGVLCIMDELAALPTRTRKQMQINTYCALKDLDAYMTGRAEGFVDGQVVNYPYDTKVTIRPPFNLCYLYSRRNNRGTLNLSTQSHLASFAARVTFMMCAFIFRDVSRNDSTAPPDYAGTMINNSIQLNEKRHGAHMTYLVPGMGQVYFPLRQVADLFALEGAKRYLRYQSQGSGEGVEEMAKLFFQEVQLDLKVIQAEVLLDPTRKDRRQAIQRLVYNDKINELFKKRIENREQILGFGNDMTSQRRLHLENQLEPNIARVVDERWRKIEEKTARLMVDPKARYVGARDFLEDIEFMIAEQLTYLDEKRLKAAKERYAKIATTWRPMLFKDVDDVCSDDGIFDRLRDNFAAPGVAANYASFLNESEEVIHDFVCLSYCRAVLANLAEKVVKMREEIDLFITTTVPHAIRTLENEFKKISTLLYDMEHGNDDDVYGIASFNVLNQEWRDNYFAKTGLVDSSHVASFLLESDWHPNRFIKEPAPKGVERSLFIAQQVFEKVIPMMDSIRQLTPGDLLGNSDKLIGLDPLDMIARIKDMLLQPQMDLGRMKSKFGVDLSTLLFTGGIDEKLRDELKRAPQFQHSTFHISENFESQRLNFFTVTLPVGIAGCNVAATTLAQSYELWRDEIGKLPKSEFEYEIRQFHCYPNSFYWPDPIKTQSEADKEMVQFTRVFALSELLDVSEADEKIMDAVSKQPRSKRYGLFQAGRSAFWLMPFFEPGGGSITGKPIRLGSNIYDAYLEFQKKPEFADHAGEWVRWFEETCMETYNKKDLRQKRQQVLSTIEERKGRTHVPKNIDLFDQMKRIIEEWEVFE